MLPLMDVCLMALVMAMPFIWALLDASCSYRLLEVDVSVNRLTTLPSGFLHLTKLQKLLAAKNYMEKLFEEENSMCVPMTELKFPFAIPGLILQARPNSTPTSSHKPSPIKTKSS